MLGSHPYRDVYFMVVGFAIMMWQLFITAHPTPYLLTFGAALIGFPLVFEEKENDGGGNTGA